MNDSPMEQLIKSLTKRDDTKVVYKEWHDDKLEKIAEDEATLLLKLGYYLWKVESGKHNN